MHAFDFILVLFSFVYAAAVTHLISTAGEIIIASRRIRLSWFNAGDRGHAAPNIYRETEAAGGFVSSRIPPGLAS